MTRLTFLGTGTSQGVPIIACRCPVCRNSDRRDKRFRKKCGKYVERALDRKYLSTPGLISGCRCSETTFPISTPSF